MTWTGRTAAGGALSTVGALVLCVSALPLGSCTDYVRGAPPGSEITLVANPDFIVAPGGVSVITAIVMEAEIGTPVADGTVVQFFTNLGNVDAQVKTKGGIARANLVSDSRSGEAEVTAVSGAVVESVIVGIGSFLPKTVIAVADPPSLRPGQISYLTVNVFDTDGNPVAKVPVVLSLTSTERDTLTSGGRQIFTDSNGQAFDELHAASITVKRDVTIKVTTSSGKQPGTELKITVSP